MEPDRYRQNHFLYVIGLIFLVFSLSLFAFSAYIIPFLLFKWSYDVPEFISTWQQWLLERDYSNAAACWLIFLFFIVLALFCAAIAHIASNRIDNKLYKTEVEAKVEPARSTDDTKETTNLLVKIVFIVILVFIGALLFQWLISSPTPIE